MKNLTRLIIFLSISIPVSGASSNPAAQDGTIKWSYEIRGVVTKGGVALGTNGTVYAGDSAGFLYAVKDGSLKWEINLNPKEPYENFPQYDGPLPKDIKKEQIPDSIILPDNVLTSENLSHSSPTLTSDGKKLYIGGINSGKVYCINTEDGSVEWKFDVRKIPEVKADRLHMGGGFCSSPAIGDDGTIYIGSGDWWGDQWVEAKRMGIDIDKLIKRRFSDKRLYALNPDGTLKWTFRLEATDTFRTSIFGCPAIGPDGIIYFGGFNGIFYAIKDRGDKPKELWRYEVKTDPLSTAPTKYQEFWGSAAVAEDGTIYIGNNDYHLYAFNPDGTVKWKFKTDNEVYQSVTIGADGTIYIASEDRNLYALNPDGTLKWSKKPLDRGIPFTVTVADDETIIFGVSGRDRIIALDGKTGEFKWKSVFDKTDREDGTSNDPAIGTDGTVYVYAAGRIYAVNGSSPLSTKSPWPKVNKNNRNSGNSAIDKKKPGNSPKAQLEAEIAKLGPSIHDPSELQYENGCFMTFSTGKGIRSWYRNKNTDTWKLADILHKPEWWDKVFPDNDGYFWAPCAPSKWVIYYSFEADEDYASAIGRAVATGTAPNLQWEDDGPVLIMPACREQGTSCPVAIDPSVFKDDKGNLYMAFGSGTSGIWIVELDAETGHLTAEAAEGFSEDNDAFHRVAYREMNEPRGNTEYIEAGYVYRHPTNGYYYLFVNWGQCCSGMDSTYQIMVGRSKLPTGPFLDKDQIDMVDQGGTLLIETQGRYIGPGHASIYRHTDGKYAFSFHYYDGNRKGRPHIAVRNLTWPNNWPRVSETDFFETH